MMEIKIFTNEEFGEIRTVEINGEPWFVGKDVAVALGYTKPRNALSTHVDENDKQDTPIQSYPGGTQKMTIINDSGLYSLIFSSKLPKAKEFKRWVTSEVLTSIRKTSEQYNNLAYSCPNKCIGEALFSQHSITKNNIDIFYFSDIPIRVLGTFNDPLFCLVDVCKALGLEQVSRVKSRLIEDGVTISKVIDNLGRVQEAIFINEANLYKTIFQSRKPDADKFIKWVTSEVLPSIRKTGSYGDNSEFLCRITKFAEETTESIHNLASEVAEIKEQTNKKSLPEKPYNPWFGRMHPKYSMLEEHFDITRGALYRNILMEMENKYGVDTQQIQSDYCFEHGVSNCYALEPFENNSKYREMIETIVNNILVKSGLADENDILVSKKHKTIFTDILSKKDSDSYVS